jgi:UDP-GlcNAc:undecaprenyl-phosphate GlcNAc-1-phosphate transferase
MDPTLVAVFLALVVLLIFGAWDDSRDLDYRLKFLGQFAAVFIVVLVGDIKIAVFPFAGFEPVSDLLSIPVTILFLVGITNAVNLSDGLDGLAGGVSLLSLCAIALLAYLGEGQDIVLICFAVAGAIFGFLRYNTYPAQVFMGDTGSQFLGFMIGVLSIVLTQKSNTALNPVIPLFLVGLPIIDTIFVMVKRLSEDRSPFSPDKNHIHHRIMALGMAHYETVVIIYLTQIGFVISAILLRYQSDLLVLACYLVLSGTLLGALLFAKERQWNAKHSRLSNYIGGLTKSVRAQRFSVNAIQCGLVLYLVFGCAVCAQVPADLNITAFFLLIILLARLVWADRLRFVPLRLLVFPTIAFAVYLMHNDARTLEIMPLELRAGLLVALLFLMLFAIRYTKNDSFQTTPTDLLVIAVAGGVGVLYERQIVDVALIPVMVGIVILFYAAELVMRQMRNCWNCFTVGMVAVLALLSVRLVV